MKKFDTSYWLHVKAKKVAAKRATQTNIKSKHATDVEKLIELINQFKTDITIDYPTWCAIGFALVHTFGEEGRKYFHQISKYHQGYNKVGCDQQYNKCLKDDGNGITLKTLFYHAKAAGITVNNLKKEVFTAKPWNQKTFEKLPIVLQHVLGISNDIEEKRVLLASALGAISAVLPKIFTIYNGLKLYPNLYIFITGKPASKKGQARHVKAIVKPINEYIKKEYKGLNMLFLPANSSSSGFIQLLEANNGGLLYETEADTIGNAFKTDYGQYDDTFRKAFQHESISLYRKTDKENVYIDCPKLSCVLTGTPGQILNVVSSAENGLFSRFSFFKTNGAKKWNRFTNEENLESAEQSLDHVAETLLEYFQFLETETEKQFSLTASQLSDFHDKMAEIYEGDLLTNSEDFEASIKRTGIVFIRIAMIISTLRQLEDGTLPEKFECYDDDYQLAWEITSLLLKDTFEVFESMIQSKPKLHGSKKELLESLPFEFNYSIYKQVASDLKIPLKTAEKWIPIFCKEKQLIRQGHNQYLNQYLDQ